MNWRARCGASHCSLPLVGLSPRHKAHPKRNGCETVTKSWHTSCKHKHAGGFQGSANKPTPPSIIFALAAFVRLGHCPYLIPHCPELELAVSRFRYVPGIAGAVNTVRRSSRNAATLPQNILCAASPDVISTNHPLDLPRRTAPVVDEHDLAFLQGAHRWLYLDRLRSNARSNAEDGNRQDDQ
jgi:hypothetical protein